MKKVFYFLVLSVLLTGFAFAKDSKVGPGDYPLGEARIDAFFDLHIVKVCVLVEGHMYCYFPHGDTQGTKDIYVKPNREYSIWCVPGLRTPPTSQITEVDAAYWGTGKFAYTVDLSLDGVPKYCDTPCIAKTKSITTLYTPKFTWADVQTWGVFKHWMFPYQVHGVRLKPGTEDIGRTFKPICVVMPDGWPSVDLYILNESELRPAIHVVESFPIPKPGDAVGMSKVGPQEKSTPGGTPPGDDSKKQTKTKPQVSSVQAIAKPDLAIKSFSLYPQKPIAGLPFNLIIEFWNKGSAASAANQQYSQSCKVVSGGPTCPVTAATGTLPVIPANGTHKVTLSGLKGPKGSYEVTVKLLPESAHKKSSCVFSIIEPGQ